MSTSKLSVEDQLELLALYGRYARTVDGGDAEGFVALFTEDGSFARTNPSPASSGGSGLPPQAFRGRAELHLLILDLAKVFQGKMRHQLTDIAIEPGDGPDEARGVCYGLITDWREGQAARQRLDAAMTERARIDAATAAAASERLELSHQWTGAGLAGDAKRHSAPATRAR